MDGDQADGVPVEVLGVADRGLGDHGHQHDLGSAHDRPAAPGPGEAPHQQRW